MNVYRRTISKPNSDAVTLKPYFDKHRNIRFSVTSVISAYDFGVEVGEEAPFFVVGPSQSEPVGGRGPKTECYEKHQPRRTNSENRVLFVRFFGQVQKSRVCKLLKTKGRGDTKFCRLKIVSPNKSFVFYSLEGKVTL